MWFNPDMIKQPTEKERKEIAFRLRMKKAKHMAERIKMMLDGIEKDKNFNKTQKESLKKELLKFVK